MALRRMQTLRRLAGPSRPRPPSPPCLDREYPSSQRGGTLLAADVRTLAQHEHAIADADRYRPERCPTCSAGQMHVHDYRERKPRGELDGPPVIEVLRFVCAACEAVWLVLPSFLARHLWRVWTTVGVIVGRGSRGRVDVPARTQRRWRARLQSSAHKLVSVLAGAGEALAKIAGELGHDASRRALVDALGGATELAPIAELVHRLAAGVRVM